MIRNFLFHRVNPIRDKLWDPMDTTLFERCVKFLSMKYSVELFENIAFSESVLNSKNEYATIMFDDGYKDNITHAAPILDKYNVKASFYVVTDCIDKCLPTWTYILDYVIQHSKVNSLKLNSEKIPMELRNIDFDDSYQRIEYAKKLKPLLKTLPHNIRTEILDEIRNAMNDVKIPKLMMSWNDLQSLHSKGHYIGSHTVTHSMLGTIEDDNVVLNELTLSGKKIEEKLGYYPLTISYPIGSFNESTKVLSHKAGYKIGLAVKQKVYNPKKEDLFEVSRIELYNEPWWKTKMRITNQLETIKKLIGYK